MTTVLTYPPTTVAPTLFAHPKAGRVTKGVAVLTITSAFVLPVTEMAWTAVGMPWSSVPHDGLHQAPHAAFEYVTDGGAAMDTVVDLRQADASQDRNSVSGLRLVSGLTSDQIARLFGVSRRSVQNWVAGDPMAAVHEERLSRLYSVVLASGAKPEERRKKLLSSADGKSIFHQLIGELNRGPLLEPAAVSARHAIGV